MIFGADVQNKNLKDAGSRPKDTSHRTLTSNKYAARVSSSKNSSVGADTSGAPSTSHESRARINRSDNIKGSWEGLDKSSSAYINMNGSGYDNKSIQTARNFKPQSSHNSVNFSKESFTKRNSLDIINNMSRSSSSKSSSQKVDMINKRNNLL
jgi:hypothetical protein